MNVLALVGSPRVKSNTDLVIDQILEGAKSKGYTTEKLYLYNYTISLCTDCRACKKGDFVCCLNDDMKHVYPKLEQADILVFGTPLYWYGPTAKMKMLIDRLRPFVENKKLKGKRAVIVVPSAEGAHACELVNEMFRLSLDYIGVELLGNLFVTAYEKAEIANNKQELARAYALGASFQV